MQKSPIEVSCPGIDLPAKGGGIKKGCSKIGFWNSLISRPISGALSSSYAGAGYFRYFARNPNMVA